MYAIKTLREADKFAKSIGLKRGKGTCNGAAYWVRPYRPGIITLSRLEELYLEHLGGADGAL